MSTIKVNAIQHTGGANVAMTLEANGDVAFSNNVSYSANTSFRNKLSVTQNTAASSHGYAASFVDNNNAVSNFVPFDFVQTYGNHSWGTIARYRITGTASDRPSIQFSSGHADQRWNVGFCTGSDDNFRITQNLGYRNDGVNQDGWGTERFKIDTNGIVTMPYHPSFMVAKGNGGGALAQGQTIVWDVVSYNVGSCYNSTNGRFTAPVTGRYFFSCFVLGSSGGTDTGQAFIFYINDGNSGYNPYTRSTGASYTQCSGSVVLSLNAGDYVTVYLNEGTIYATGARHNGFCGHLIG